MGAICDHNEVPHRRLICCLLAVEIAEYEAKPVFEQIRSTQELRTLLFEATAHTSSDTVVSIVREDGALLSFLANPEECFTTALAIQGAALTQNGSGDLPLRIGINLGTVEIAEDEIGCTYVSGEGRQDADRVMRYGPPRQISVARPFVELLSRTAPGLSGLLEYQGVFSDTVGPPLCLYRLPPRQNDGAQSQSHLPASTEQTSDAIGAVVQSTTGLHAVDAQTPVNGRRWLPSRRRALVPLLAGTVLFGASTRLQLDTLDASPAVPFAGAFAPVALISSPPAGQRTEGTRAGDRGQHSLRATSWRIAVPGKRMTQKSRVAGENTTMPDPVQQSKTAWLVLAVKPWGEVYVDGRKIGITPPLKRFQVPSGRRQITVTNSSLPSYQIHVTLDPEEQVTVTHDFACVPDRERVCREDLGKGLVLNSRFRFETVQAAR